MNDIKPIRLFNIYGFTGMNYAGNVWDKNSISPALLTMTGGNRQPLILTERKSNNMGKFIKLIDDTNCGFNPIPKVYEDYAPTLRAGRYGLKVLEERNMDKCLEQDEIINDMPDGTCRTLKAQYQQTSRANLERVGSFGATGVKRGIRIRKLTPTECYKLMGFTAEDCKKCSEGGISNAQLYKQAGNSIVVNVLEAIFKSLGDKYVEFRS